MKYLSCCPFPIHVFPPVWSCQENLKSVDHFFCLGSGLVLWVLCFTFRRLYLCRGLQCTITSNEKGTIQEPFLSEKIWDLLSKYIPPTRIVTSLSVVYVHLPPEATLCPCSPEAFLALPHLPLRPPPMIPSLQNWKLHFLPDQRQDHLYQQVAWCVIIMLLLTVVNVLYFAGNVNCIIRSVDKLCHKLHN